jgi:hypothetical protein
MDIEGVCVSYKFSIRKRDTENKNVFKFTLFYVSWVHVKLLFAVNRFHQCVTVCNDCKEKYFCDGTVLMLFNLVEIGKRVMVDNTDLIVY